MAPEKIYLYPSDRAGEEYEEEWGDKPWGEDCVEYTRTDTLEVKEVDLDRAIDKWIDDAAITHEDCSITDVISTAKHFFELGLKTQKGE